MLKPTTLRAIPFNGRALVPVPVRLEWGTPAQGQMSRWNVSTRRWHKGKSL